VGAKASGVTQLNELGNTLWSLLTHYKAVFVEHNIALPFSEIPPQDQL
jgi:hypothetical protein